MAGFSRVSQGAEQRQRPKGGHRYTWGRRDKAPDRVGFLKRQLKEASALQAFLFVPQKRRFRPIIQIMIHNHIIVVVQLVATYLAPNVHSRDSHQ